MNESLRDILGDNLTRLMQQSEKLASFPSVEKATKEIGSMVSKSTVERASKGATPLNLDAIEALARVFRIEPWQLLVPNLNPKNLPSIGEVGAAQLPLLAQLASLAHQIAALTPPPVEEARQPLRKLPR